MIRDSEISNLIKLRSLLSPGASDHTSMVKKLEMTLTPKTISELVAKTGRDPASVEKLIKGHIGTKFAEECINSLEIKTQRNQFDQSTIKYSTEAVVLSRAEFMDIIRFCILNRELMIEDQDADNRQD